MQCCTLFLCWFTTIKSHGKSDKTAYKLLNFAEVVSGIKTLEHIVKSLECLTFIRKTNCTQYDSLDGRLQHSDGDVSSAYRKSLVCNRYFFDKCLHFSHCFVILRVMQTV